MSSTIEAESAPVPRQDRKKHAIKVILLLGLVSLLADVTYEGARSLNGQYLAVLGATGWIVGTTAGLGEFAAYALRLLTGRLSDRFNAPWLFVFAGYGLNIVVVPVLGLVGQWPLAAGLIVGERVGKAIRSPSRDAILSDATVHIGHGRGFGLHGAIDQFGAVTGPLMLAGVLRVRHSYALAYGILAIPAVLSVVALVVARSASEAHAPAHRPTVEALGDGSLPRQFWIFLIGAALLAAGYADFALIAFHLKTVDQWPAGTIALTYAMAMAAESGASLVLGRLFDKLGVPALVMGVVLPSASVAMAFLGGPMAIIVGIVLWGAGLGVQSSILKAQVAHLAPRARRGWAFGTFHGAFGVAWLVGSVALGALHDVSLVGLVATSVGLQFVGLPFLISGARTTGSPA